jgi:hypothetical protein
MIFGYALAAATRGLKADRARPFDSRDVGTEPEPTTYIPGQLRWALSSGDWPHTDLREKAREVPIVAVLCHESMLLDGSDR